MSLPISVPCKGLPETKRPLTLNVGLPGRVRTVFTMRLINRAVGFFNAGRPSNTSPFAPVNLKPIIMGELVRVLNNN